MKNVLITGADRNIGLEMVKQFLERGWNVFAGRYLMDLPFLENLQAANPGILTLVPLDVSDDQSVSQAAGIIAQKVDHLDMLVHNAAGFGDHAVGGIQAIDYSKFWIPYNINALGAIRLVHTFLPLMQKGMKRLCFTSSEAGVVSVAHRTEPSSYCMSKTALNMAIRLMFNQLQPMGYSFRMFHPGWVRSPKVETVAELEKVKQYPKVDGKILDENGNIIGKFWPWEAAEEAVPQFIEDREWEDCLSLIDNEGAAWPF